jgi:hypothetical protein
MMAQETLAGRKAYGKNRSRRASDTYPDEDRHQAPPFSASTPCPYRMLPNNWGNERATRVPHIL